MNELPNPPAGPDTRIGQGYQWNWPAVKLDIDQLDVSRPLISELLSPRGRQVVANIMSDGSSPIDQQALNRIYQIGSEFKVTAPGKLNPYEKLLFGELSDSIKDWFFNSNWMFQPASSEEDEASNGGRVDTRYQRLLLPAHMINTLTKLALNGSIEDVERESLITLSDEAYSRARASLTHGHFRRVALAIGQVGQSLPKMADSGIGNSHDLQAWMKADTQGLDALRGKAISILDESYHATGNYFRPRNAAAGLYFMKSVVIGVMQEWHQERLGITDMIPPITWQSSNNGHTPYNFRNNTNYSSGDMHTNNDRFPFQRYVAHYMRDRAGLVQNSSIVES